MEVQELKDLPSDSAESSPKHKMCARTRDSCGHQRAVEEFDEVEDFRVGAMDRGAAAKWHQAAGVGGDDGLGVFGFVR